MSKPSLLSLNEAILVHLFANETLDETNIVPQLRGAQQRVANSMVKAVTQIDFDQLRDESDVDNIIAAAYPQAPSYTTNADDEFALVLRAYEQTGERRGFEFPGVVVYAANQTNAQLIFESLREQGIVE